MSGDLSRLEERLRAAVVAEDAYLTEIASHLIEAGGAVPAFDAQSVAATVMDLVLHGLEPDE